MSHHTACKRWTVTHTQISQLLVTFLSTLRPCVCSFLCVSDLALGHCCPLTHTLAVLPSRSPPTPGRLCQEPKDGSSPGFPPSRCWEQPAAHSRVDVRRLVRWTLSLNMGPVVSGCLAAGLPVTGQEGERQVFLASPVRLSGSCCLEDDLGAAHCAAAGCSVATGREMVTPRLGCASRRMPLCPARGL